MEHVSFRQLITCGPLGQMLAPQITYVSLAFFLSSSVVSSVEVRLRENPPLYAVGSITWESKNRFYNEFAR